MYVPYNVNDFLQWFAMIRIVKAGIRLINLTMWKSNSAERICLMYGCEADTMFGVKSLMKHRPISFLFGNLLAGALFFGILLRYCEAQVNKVVFDSHIDFSRLDNCLWLVLVTMTTGKLYWLLVGYGDIYPKTIFGRITMFICAIYGVVVVSVMVVAIQNTLEFSVLESKAFTCINKLNSRKELLSDASSMISTFIKVSRKMNNASESEQNKAYQTFRNISHEFMKKVR